MNQFQCDMLACVIIVLVLAFLFLQSIAFYKVMEEQGYEDEPPTPKEVRHVVCDDGRGYSVLESPVFFRTEANFASLAFLHQPSTNTRDPQKWMIDVKQQNQTAKAIDTILTQIDELLVNKFTIDASYERHQAISFVGKGAKATYLHRHTSTYGGPIYNVLVNRYEHGFEKTVKLYFILDGRRRENRRNFHHDETAKDRPKQFQKESEKLDSIVNAAVSAKKPVHVFLLSKLGDGVIWPQYWDHAVYTIAESSVPSIMGKFMYLAKSKDVEMHLHGVHKKDDYIDVEKYWAHRRGTKKRALHGETDDGDVLSKTSAKHYALALASHFHYSTQCSAMLTNQEFDYTLPPVASSIAHATVGPYQKDDDGVDDDDGDDDDEESFDLDLDRGNTSTEEEEEEEQEEPKAQLHPQGNVPTQCVDLTGESTEEDLEEEEQEEPKAQLQPQGNVPTQCVDLTGDSD